MAAPRILSRSRSLFTTTTTKQTLSSSLLSRPFSSATTTTSTPTAFSLCRIRPFASLVGVIRNPAFSSTSFRSFSSSQSQASLSDNNPNWSNRPPKETILLDGCDFEHWLVVTEPPPEIATRDEIIDSYIKTLAQIVGSEEEARMKIYSVSTKHYYAFGALVSEELSYKLKELPHVRWVLPDSYLDVKNKDYGGEPFINGQAVPYDPKYHEDWVRNNAKAQERNRRNDRPRNSDRSRNFDRRQDRNTNYQNPGPAATMGGPGGNRGGPPNADGRPNYPGGAPNMPHNNAGYAPNAPYNNDGYAPNAPHNNAGHAPNAPYNNAGHAPNAPYNNAGHAANAPYNNAGYAPNTPYNNVGYAPHNNAGYAQHNPGSAHNAPPNNQNREGMPPQGNPGYPGNNMPNYQTGGVMPYQNTPIGNQNFAPPNRNVGGQPVGEYHPQDVPGRDMPSY